MWLLGWNYKLMTMTSSVGKHEVSDPTILAWNYSCWFCSYNYITSTILIFTAIYLLCTLSKYIDHCLIYEHLNIDILCYKNYFNIANWIKVFQKYLPNDCHCCVTGMHLFNCFRLKLEGSTSTSSTSKSENQVKK